MEKSKTPAITTRYDISGTLFFQRSYHVGAGEADSRTDKGLSTDTSGAVRIPGTAFCGALRAHLGRHYPDENKIINRYFGTAADHSVSSVWIEDLYPVQENLQTIIRDGVAIRRDYLSARKGLKFDYEIAPYGAFFNLNLRIHVRKGDEDKTKQLRRLMMTALLDLKAGRIRVGGHTTRGLGRCRLDNLRIRTYQFPKDLKSVLINPPSPESGNPCVTALSNEKPLQSEKALFKVRIVCRIEKTPLLVKDGLKSKAGLVIDLNLRNNNPPRRIEADHYFVKVPTADNPDNEIPVIAGGSIKGAIRSRAEKILRTLELHACDPTENQVESKSASCAIKLINTNRLGALSVISTDDEPKNTSRLKKRHEYIELESCRICRLFGNSYLASRIQFDDSPLIQARDEDTKRLDSVALNRFTSGPKKSALFNFKPYVRGEFVINMEAQDLDGFEKSLLLFIIRDLKEDEMPILFGFGKTKGFGHVQVAKIEIDDSKCRIENATYEKYLESNKDAVFKSWRATLGSTD